jgi:hypothetical protein
LGFYDTDLVKKKYGPSASHLGYFVGILRGVRGSSTNSETLSASD